MSYDRLQEQKAAAALRMKVRGVAHLLGARYIDDNTETRHWHEIEIAPTVQLHAARAWQPRGMIRWVVCCPQTRACSASINTAITRPAAAIVADLRARLLPDAREFCRKSIAGDAERRDREHARRTAVAELEQVFGPMRENNGVHHADGFEIRHDDVLGGYRGTFAARFSVHSWHCLLMIAKLVAEDTRQARAAAPVEDENAA